jgi:hypothetical protein
VHSLISYYRSWLVLGCYGAPASCHVATPDPKLPNALFFGVFVIAIAKLDQSDRWRSAWSIVLSSLIVPVMA